MVKCGGCGKFLSTTEAASCDQCRSCYHLACVGLTATSKKPHPWRCPECKRNLVRDNRAETPVRGHTLSAREVSPVDIIDTSLNNKTALDTTQEFNRDLFKTELALLKEDLINTVRNEFQLLRDDLLELRSSLKATNDRISNLEERMTKMESMQAQSSVSSEVDDLITQLRNDINDRDQELLTNDIQISNIPESSGENPTHTAILIASKIGIKIEASDIVSAERVGGRRINASQAVTRPRFLVVRLARRDLRDELLKSARVRRGMTTADLDIPGPASRFYVNERLTKINRELFRCAREAGSRLGWQFVWSRKGRILARRKPGDLAYHIRCEADIQRTFGPTPDSTL